MKIDFESDTSRFTFKSAFELPRIPALDVRAQSALRGYHVGSVEPAPGPHTVAWTECPQEEEVEPAA